MVVGEDFGEGQEVAVGVEAVVGDEESEESEAEKQLQGLGESELV